MKYVKVDNEGKIKGFYEDTISEPPEGSVEITDDDWKQAIESGVTHFNSQGFSMEKPTKEQLEKQLMRLADTKQESAEALILGYKATPKQIERYKDKYERAKEGEFADEVNAVIIQKFEDVRSDVRQLTDLIEVYRGFVDDLIQAGELDKAEQAIEAGRSFDETTTQDDITNLFSKLSE